METFNSSDVTIYTGVPKPTLDHWIMKKWVRPSVETKAEPGSRNLFSRVDLYHIAFINKVKESGFSPELVGEKINIYPICEAGHCEADTDGKTKETIGIAMSRVIEDGEYKAQGAWIINSALDKETGWNSLTLIEKRLQEGADDFYILNFTKLKERIDDMIRQVRG